MQNDTRAARFKALIPTGEGSDLTAGIASLAREIEAAEPGFIDRMHAALVARRLKRMLERPAAT